MIYTIYDADTGEIQYTFTGNKPNDIALNLADKTYIEGNYDGRNFRIVGGEAVAKTPDPSNILCKYGFNLSTGEWEVDISKTEQLVRQYRNLELALVDKINPVWWAALSTEQQQEVSTFRIELLSVPQQETFPTEVIWPTKPSFL